MQGRTAEQKDDVSNKLKTLISSLFQALVLPYFSKGISGVRPSKCDVKFAKMMDIMLLLFFLSAGGKGEMGRGAYVRNRNKGLVFS